MGGRYYLTGVQLGMLQGYLKVKAIEEARGILSEIEENQFLFNVDDMLIIGDSNKDSIVKKIISGT